MKNILVVNVNWLGDTIFSSPVFRALKEQYPQAKISCLAVPRVREILEGVSYIDEIIEYDERGKHRGLLAKVYLIKRLRQKDFDIAFLLHRSMTRALLIYCAGIPLRVGYDTKGRGRLLTHKVVVREDLRHRSDYYLNVIESFGVPVNDRTSRLEIVDKERNEIEKILVDNGINGKQEYLLVNPGGNWDLKKWPIKRFAILVDYLIKEMKSQVIITGSTKDIALVKELTSQLQTQPIILVGQTNLKHLAALMKRARVVISADSGPLHIANSVGSKIVGIFGPTRPEVTGPRGPGKRTILQHDVGCNRDACYFLQCPDNICMKAVTVEEVIHAVREIIDQ